MSTSDAAAGGSGSVSDVVARIERLPISWWHIKARIIIGVATFFDAFDALAIAFMHAYRAPEHEQRAAAIVRSLYPDLPLSLSAEVAPEIREFERTSTACANAYVQPLMQRYLDRLETSLTEIGFAGRLYVMLSGGGITTLREAKAFPIRLIESGPAAGAMAAAFLARKLMTKAWTRVTGSEPPSHPEDPQVGLGEALAWAILTGVSVEAARLIATRAMTRKFGHGGEDNPAAVVAD